MTTEEQKIAALEAEVKKWKLVASEQTEFATRHHRDTLRAQQDAMAAHKARDVWREELAKVEAEVEKLRGDRDARTRELRDMGDTAAYLRGMLGRIADLFGDEEKQPGYNNLPGLVLQLQQENEALARQVPPEFTVKSLGTDGGFIEQDPGFIAITQPAAFTRVVGQAWCRCDHENDVFPDALVHKLQRGGWVVLCTIHQNLTTGETTYVPISFDDLPRVTEAPAL